MDEVGLMGLGLKAENISDKTLSPDLNAINDFIIVGLLHMASLPCIAQMAVICGEMADELLLRKRFLCCKRYHG